ncbi:MAG: hypothetical protein J5858_00405 [Lentisphaeria bacterium]|nr:hypothetical protein [Lentisphaeria bacterium]
MVIRKKYLFCTLLIFILLTGLGTGIWFWLRPSDENLIRARFSKLEKLASKVSKEGAIPAAGKAREIAQLFSEKSTFSVHGLDWMAGPFTRQALTGNVFRSRAMFSTLKLSLDDLELEIDSEKGIAKVFLSAALAGTLKDGRTIHEVRELESTLTKTDEGWIFENFRIREIIKK